MGSCLIDVHFFLLEMTNLNNSSYVRNRQHQPLNVRFRKIFANSIPQSKKKLSYVTSNHCSCIVTFCYISITFHLVTILSSKNYLLKTQSTQPLQTNSIPKNRIICGFLTPIVVYLTLTILTNKKNENRADCDHIS